ncbi:VacJ family lipoprotein [Halomonas qinghailakensis]|uniref:VacJ family lipoprotein n=2 Tax=Halomonas TaxID=2745 RepID=A0AA46YQS5_9GAMM|nr:MULTISPECIES: VacJ family lipoprotein [Halomonas]UYO74903.1 VacJ family lipoprotein [Halomonas sp. ZZQ-149]UYV20190.1 VacJ family lipoprotein [Halomonas qaidamensis]
MLGLLAKHKRALSWRYKGLPVLLLAILSMSGCASSGPNVSEQAHPEDPWEGFNRRVFVFNDVLDRYTLKPLAQGYQTVTPGPIQTGVGNFFSNLSEVRTALNSLLQGKPANAGLATSRFLINSTVGIGGLLDYATLMEINADKEDFGQTLAVWGWEDSRYLVLPLLGPRTLRDTTGLPFDIAAHPITYMDDHTLRAGLTALDIIHIRAGLLDQEALISGDRYRFIRDAFLQRRQFEINDGELGDDPFAMDDFEFDDTDFGDDDFAD